MLSDQLEHALVAVTQVLRQKTGINAGFRLYGGQRQLTGFRGGQLCAVRGTGHGYTPNVVSSARFA